MPALCIAMASLKGGCGKSTLSLNLAAGLVRRGQDVGLLDADPQGALRHWSAWGRPTVPPAAPAAPDVPAAPDAPLAAGSTPPVWAAHTDTSAVLARALATCATVIVDCPPSLDWPVTRSVLERADIVLIPFLPSALDLWAGASTVTAVQAAQVGNPRLRAWLLLNQVEPQSALSRAMTQALAALPVPTLRSVVRRRAAFRLAAVEGVSVYQLGARGRDAAREIDAVIEEIFPA